MHYCQWIEEVQTFGATLCLYTGVMLQVHILCTKKTNWKVIFVILIEEKTPIIYSSTFGKGEKVFPQQYNQDIINMIININK